VSVGLASETVHKSTTSAEKSVNGKSHAHNELLFSAPKIEGFTFRRPGDFYTSEEVKKAHDILSKYVKQRLPPHSL